MLFYVLGAAILGLLVGSFLNVCIYRIPRDISVVAPRSFCPECGVQISWFDNIPVLSYFLLRGRCRKCGQRIGARYPFVEIITATLFIVVAYRYGIAPAAGKWLLWEAILVVLFWTDLEEQILPDELTLGGAIAGIVIACFLPVQGLFVETLFPGWKPLWRSLIDIGLGIAVLAVPMWLLGIAYEKVRKREGLGFGDVKLLVLMSTFLGFENSLLATMIGAVGGSVVGVAYCLTTRRKLSETHLPFGSFLCAGAGIVPLIYRLAK
jgi:leader peptidase (prepilin peptidase)/N-methyltransferase